MPRGGAICTKTASRTDRGGHEQFQTRRRRRRHRARHLGHARPLDERHRHGRDRGIDRRGRQGRRRRRHQGRGDHLGQGSLLRRRRPHDAGENGRALRRDGAQARRGSRRQDGVRREPQALAALPAAGNLRQALGLRAQRHRHGRRLRARARLPPSRRRRQRQDPARPARDQGRPVPRRRRHAARRAPAAAGRRAAISAQGRPAQGRPRQGAQAGRQRRAAGRPHHGGEGLDQGRRQAGRALGRAGFPPARRRGLFQGRHDDLPGGQRHLPARDLRQLPGRARDFADRLRGPAGADGHGAAHRVALVRQDPALAGSRRHDPLAVRLHAGAEQRRAPPGRRAAERAQEDRRHRRRLHGRRHRAGVRRRRPAGGADRPRPGDRRQRQGRRAQGAVGSRQQRPHEIGRARRAVVADRADLRLRRARRLRPHRRGGVRGPQGQGRGDRQDPGRHRQGRDPRLQHLDAADHLARRRVSRSRRASSASISSRRSTA